MVEMPSDQPSSSEPVNITADEAAELITALRRKQGNWVAWAAACQTLQKSGLNPQRIFEETGFEPIQQNQIMGAAQVYASMLKAGVSESVQTHFTHRASDVLYELRMLPPEGRSAAAAFAFTRSMDMLEAREMAKAMKDFSRISPPPSMFSAHPGDILAYYAWQAAKQKLDLQARSGFIARGLKFAHTEVARKQIELLLTDFAVATTQRVPRMPVYRLDSDEELPRVMPVVGAMPLTVAEYRSVPFVVSEEPFGMVQFEGAAAWVPIPGWLVIRKAEDPVVLLARSEELPTRLEGDEGPVLVIVDRAARSWDVDSYFIMAGENETLSIQWLAVAPAMKILGKVILVMRAKKILDEGHSQEMYQWDE
jgi:hypothetical protein